MGAHHNAYHGYFYVEEHPPPPPPHAYELQSYPPQPLMPYGQQEKTLMPYGQQEKTLMPYGQQDILCCPPPGYPDPPNVAAITCDEPTNANTTVPVPLPRNFDLVPYVEPQPPPLPPHQHIVQQPEEVCLFTKFELIYTRVIQFS